MTALLLTSQNSTGHVHLIIGANSLANARCAKSIEVGATAKVIAPADAEINFGIQKKVDDGCVELVQKGFEEADLSTLGREEADYVVDAVFVTVGVEDAQCIRPYSFVHKNPLTQSYRLSHFESLQTFANSSQRDRHAESVHFLAAFYIFRWAFANRCNNLRPRLQIDFSDPTRNYIMPPS